MSLPRKLPFSEGCDVKVTLWFNPLFSFPLCSLGLCGKTDCIELKGFERGTPYYNSDGLFEPSLSDTIGQQRNRR